MLFTLPPLLQRFADHAPLPVMARMVIAGSELYRGLGTVLVMARMVIASTPKFAKQIAWKFSHGSSVAVQRDFSENHGRRVA